MDIFKTPDYSHLTHQDYENVYEPAEDTFLLIDALEKDHHNIVKLRPSVCVEIGCGSGLISTFLAKILQKPALCLATDCNPIAAQCAKRTANQNKVSVELVTSDLLSALRPRLDGAIDLLMFNPPYVVTPSEEVGSSGIANSWAGGIHGREVIDRLLPQVPQLLTPKGIFYLLVLRENKPDEIREIMSGMGLKSEVVLQRRTGPEHLSILKFYKDPNR